MKTIISKPNTRNAKFLWAFFLILFITHHSSFITSAHAQACASTTPSVLAKWTFQEFTANAQCNGAIQRSNAASRIYPVLKSDAYVYCPDINSGCGQALLGSTGHTNTTDFSNALCLMNFYYVESLIGGKFCTGIPCNGYDPNSTVWNPAIPANIYTTYIIPQGKYGCLSSFSLKISTPNSTTPTFAKQGVAVYRNGVQIYSQTQNITKPHEVMTFTFPSTAMFCSDGSKEVTYKVVFGLVERLTDFKAGRPTGYDDITINGTCGSNPSPIAAVTPATCSATGANSDGRISVVPGSFATTYKAAYSKGSTYTGTATYASGSTAIPITGTVDAKLPNPASPQTYTMRIFSPTCYTDKTVTLNPVVCPVTCSSPTAKVAAVLATCTGTTANNNAQIAVTGVTYGDKVAISTGATYTGTATYTTATPLVSAAYTFTGLPNPATNQTYTVRVYNGSNTCFKDFQVILANKDCTPVIACTFPDGTVNATPATCTGGIANSDAQINVSGVSNGDKAAYSIGNTYTGTTTYATATALVSGATNFTGLANPAANQTYTVRIYNGSNTCFKDYQVILANKDCAPVVPCTFPDGIVNTTSATCTGSTANSDAKINVSGVSNGDKAAYSVGNTYTGTTNYATATTLVGGATNFLGLENPAVSQVYTVRIFNGKDNCYKDFPVTINTTICVPTCTTPTGTVTPTQATCTGSTANSNAQIAITAVSNGDKVAYSIGSVFSGNNYSAATALVGGAYTFTALPNTVGGQIYTVRIYNGSDACYRDYSVTINEKICVPTCTTPTGTVTTTQATCTGSTANSDAQIAISAVSNGDKVAYSVGSEFSGNNYSVATALVGGAYTFTALPNTVGGEIYTIRIYNGSDACYRDYSVTINEKTCVPACTRPTGTITPTDATCTAGTANNNAQIAITAVTNGNKVGIFADDIYTGPAYSAATALVSGAYTFTALSNPTSVTTYTIRVFNGNDVCYQDYNVNINSTTCPVPIPPCVPPIGTVLTATQATCGASGMTNIDANVAVTAVTGGDKVGISAGDSYTGVSYDKAVALAAGAYTFTGLPNPSGTQVYTVRVFNGADDCFTDETVTLTEKVCGACQTACGSISSALATDAVSSNNTACFAICLGTQNIDLKLTAGVSPTAGSTCGSTGTDFVWTFTLQNTGTMAATDIQVADLMPDGLTFDSANPSVGTYSPGSGWLVPSLAAGASATLTVTTKALVAGTYKYTAEVMSASPLNDPNSTPANGVSTEDDYSSATATATGNSSPTISKEFSPMQTKANTPVRLTIKITNNEPTPVSLTQDFIDVFPTSPVGGTPAAGTPAAMVVAATPNLSGSLTGVIATAGGASIKIPSGTVLLPGLNQISVDVIVPSDGMYCNDIAVGSLKTTMGNNCLATEACVIASSNFQIPPSIKKSFSVSSVNTNTNATLTITIKNQDPLNFTLSEKFVDYLPTGLILGGVTSGTCPNISTFGSTDQVGLTAGAVIPTGSCTIVVPVKSATAGTYCNRIGLNQLTGTIGTYENIGNQNIAEACLTVVAAPCAALDLTNITQSPIGNVAPNATVNFTTLGTGIDGTKTAFNWSNSSIGGRFNPQGNTATWTAPTTAGVYTLKVMGDNQVTGYGACKDSVTLSITVTQACTPPVATILPKTQTICVGSVATAYTVSPSTGVEYTWYGPLADTTSSLGTAIASQTTAMFTPSGTTLTTAGTKYYAVVVNNTGEVTCADTAFVQLTVNAKPNAGIDQSLACANAGTNTLTTSTTLAPVTAGGTFTQIGTSPATATIAGNAVSGMSVAGTYQFEYSLNGCKDTVAVTVNPCTGCVKPNAGTDAAAICQPVSTAKLTAVTAGGTWSAQTGNPATATIDVNGNITGLSTAGTYKFIYSVTGGGITCTDTAQVVVNAKPVIADGTATICAGESVDLTTKITSYATYLSPVWTIATASGTAVSTPTSVKPTATATYVLVAQNALGCKDTANVVVTVNAKPNAGIDQSLACANAGTNTLTTSTTLAPVTAGGTFTQIGTSPAVATIAGNAVSGMSVAGTYQFEYSLNGCKDTVAVTVNPCTGCVKPNAGTDAAAICQPVSTAKLTAVTTGGTWSAQTGNPATTTIDNNGNITGLSTAGTYKFIYSVTGGGITCTDTAQVVVNAKPVIADGTATICAGESVDLTTKITSYATYVSPVWTIATASGTAVSTPTAVKPTATTTYVLVAQNAAGCKDTSNVVVTVNAIPAFEAHGIAASCNGVSSNNDARILIYGMSNGSKMGYNAGLSYTGTYASATFVSGNTASITGLSTSSSTTKYTVRIYEADANCYKDVVVLLPLSECNASCVIDAGENQLLCEPISTINLKDAASTEEWVVGTNNPVAAVIDASTGLVTGMTTNGVYSFILRDKTNASCSDEVFIFRSVLDMPSLTSCETSYQLPTTSGVAWSLASGSATVSSSGLISGMTTNGIYQFTATFGTGCTANVDVVKVTCACVAPNAGADFTICLPKTTANLKDASSGYEWVVGSGNPALASIHASTGVITGMTATGTYKFILQKTGDATCSDEIQITVTNGDTPIVLCNDGSTSYTLIAQSGLVNVIWYNMAGVQVGTGVNLVVKSTTIGLEDGTEAFYYVGQNGTLSGCDVELCCPVKFLTQTCCPTPNCVGVTVIKTK